MEDVSDLKLYNHSQQTSPYTPEKDLFSLLQEVCERYSKDSGHRSSNKQNTTVDGFYDSGRDNERGKSARSLGDGCFSKGGSLYPGEDAREDDYEDDHVRGSVRLPQKNVSPPRFMHRAASANDYQTTHMRESHLYRAASLSPSRMGLNTYYTHRSLPDLSFLKEKRKSFVEGEHGEGKSGDRNRSCSPESSLFDPVKIPIILSPIVDVEHTLSYSCPACRSHSNSPTRRQTTSCCGCPCSHRSKTSPCRCSVGLSKRSRSFVGVCKVHRSQSSPVRGTQLHHSDLTSQHCTDHTAQLPRKWTNSGQTIYSKVKKDTHSSEKPRSSSCSVLKDRASVDRGVGGLVSTVERRKKMVHQTSHGMPKVGSVPHSSSCSRAQKTAGIDKSGRTGIFQDEYEDDDGRVENDCFQTDVDGVSCPDESAHPTSTVSSGARSKQLQPGRLSEVFGGDRIGSDGSDGFTPTDGGCIVPAIGSSCGSTSSGADVGNNFSAKSASSTTSSSSSSSKKVTSGQYVVSCFSSSSVSSIRSDQKSSTSTLGSKSQDSDQKFAEVVLQTRTGSQNPPGEVSAGGAVKLQYQNNNSGQDGFAVHGTGMENMKNVGFDKKVRTGKERSSPSDAKTSDTPASSTPPSSSAHAAAYAADKCGREVKSDPKLSPPARLKDGSKDQLRKVGGDGMSANSAPADCSKKMDNGFADPLCDELRNEELLLCEDGGFCQPEDADYVVTEDNHYHENTGYEDPDVLACCGCACSDKTDQMMYDKTDHLPCCQCGIDNAENMIHALVVEENADISEGLKRILFQPPYVKSNIGRDAPKTRLCNNINDTAAGQESNSDNFNKSERVETTKIEINGHLQADDGLRMSNSLTEMKTSASGNALLAKKRADKEKRRTESDGKDKFQTPTTKPASRVVTRVRHKSASRCCDGGEGHIPGSDCQAQSCSQRRWSTGSSLNTLCFDPACSGQEENGHICVSPPSSYDNFTPEHSSSICQDAWHAQWDHHSKFICVVKLDSFRLISESPASTGKKVPEL